MRLGKKSVGVFFAIILVGLPGTAQAKKSLYVISSTNYHQMQAYEIDGTSLSHQVTIDTTHALPVGLTIHESFYGKWLFCKDWLWVAPWSARYEQMMFASGGRTTDTPTAIAATTQGVHRTAPAPPPPKPSR